MLRICCTFSLVLLLSSSGKDKSGYAFFQSQKSAVDSVFSGFQPSENLYFRDFFTPFHDRFAGNRYYLRTFKSGYGDIFSDTLNDMIRYMLVQGDCEVWLYYTRNGKPLKIDFLKMFGGIKSYYLIDQHKTLITDDNRKQSWCTRDTSSYHVEICLDDRKIIHYQRHGYDVDGFDTTRYLRPDIAHKKLRAGLLEKFERVRNGD